MKLRGIEFGNVFIASGTLNFFGNGWWYNILYQHLFHGFKEIENCTFVSKTTTWNPHAGNMPLKENLQPKALLPDCIKLCPFKGIMLSAVDFSGPGAEALFAAGIWQTIEKPFFISFVAVGKNQLERMFGLDNFIELCKREFPNFKAPVGIQLDLSYLNTGYELEELGAETISALQKLSVLNVPIDLKVNVFFSTGLLKVVAIEKLCDVITISNTIPFGAAPGKINWEKLFRKGHSPLKKYGGGGLSSKAILPLVLKKIEFMRTCRIEIPIKGGDGIMRPDDVNKIKKAGADIFEFAIVAMFRPWRVKKIIERAEEIFKDPM